MQAFPSSQSPSVGVNTQPRASSHVSVVQDWNRHTPKPSRPHTHPHAVSARCAGTSILARTLCRSRFTPDSGQAFLRRTRISIVADLRHSSVARALHIAGFAEGAGILIVAESTDLVCTGNRTPQNRSPRCNYLRPNKPHRTRTSPLSARIFHRAGIPVITDLELFVLMHPNSSSATSVVHRLPSSQSRRVPLACSCKTRIPDRQGIAILAGGTIAHIEGCTPGNRVTVVQRAGIAIVAIRIPARDTTAEKAGICDGTGVSVIAGRSRGQLGRFTGPGHRIALRCGARPSLIGAIHNCGRVYTTLSPNTRQGPVARISILQNAQSASLEHPQEPSVSRAGAIAAGVPGCTRVPVIAWSARIHRGCRACPRRRFTDGNGTWVPGFRAIHHRKQVELARPPAHSTWPLQRLSSSNSAQSLSSTHPQLATSSPAHTPSAH